MHVCVLGWSYRYRSFQILLPFCNKLYRDMWRIVARDSLITGRTRGAWRCAMPPPWPVSEWTEKGITGEVFSDLLRVISRVTHLLSP